MQGQQQRGQCQKHGDFLLHVVVVESHQHVLEHIHTVLRLQRRYQRRQWQRRKENQKDTSPPPWSMIHYDAHPDLACPGKHIPAVGCFTPRREFVYHEEEQREKKSMQQVVSTKNLYELLDSTSSGIAEWILPLVLAADLRAVHWIRPKESLQLPLGKCDFHVGAWTETDNTLIKKDLTTADAKQNNYIKSFLDLPDTAIIKVDLQHPYYLEDSCVVPTVELCIPQSLHLSILELPNQPKEERSAWRQNNHLELDHTTTTTRKDGPSKNEEGELPTTFQKNASSNWALDICLDTFACLNPFLVDIEKVNPHFSKALVDVFTNTRFHTTYARTFSSLFVEEKIEGDTTQHNTCVETASTQQTKNEDKNNGHDSTSTMYEKEYFGFIDCLSTFLHVLAKGHENQSIELSLEYTELLTYYESKEMATKIVHRMIENLKASKDNMVGIISMTIGALPNLKLPHSPMRGNEEAVRQIMYGRIQAAIEQIYNISSNRAPEFGCNGDPFIITIARSADDGFTPDFLVEEAQRMILVELHAIFCGCTALSKITETLNSNVTPSDFQNSADNCRWNVIFDYGEWEGSSFE